MKCKNKFPVLGILLLILGILWLLTELNVFTLRISWWPIIIIVVAVGMVYNKFIV